jgi:hypothetical protein
LNFEDNMEWLADEKKKEEEEEEKEKASRFENLRLGARNAVEPHFRLALGGDEIRCSLGAHQLYLTAHSLLLGVGNIHCIAFGRKTHRLLAFQCFHSVADDA